MKKSKKEFENLQYFEGLQEDPSFSTKSMFGCLAVYYGGLNVALLASDPGSNTYRNEVFDFDLWDGILIPTDRVHHASLLKEFPELKIHPVLGKWLYLPQQTEGFEEILMRLIRKIKLTDPRFGILPKSRAKKKAAKNSRQGVKPSRRRQKLPN